MEGRFNKANVAKLLYEQWVWIGDHYDFTSMNGSIQVAGHSGDTKMAYGKWIELHYLMTALDLWDLTKDLPGRTKGCHNGCRVTDHPSLL